MINTSEFFFERTGVNAKFIPISLTTKSGQKIICHISALSLDLGMMFCPMLLVPTNIGMRFMPYDICTDDLFVPVDMNSIQSQSKLNTSWEKVWEKYATSCVKSMPLTDFPKHDNYFKIDEDESRIH